MAEYRIARPEQREDLVDFGNYVFSQAHRPHDFKTLIPKNYGDQVPSEEMASYHYVAMEGEKIRGMVACPLVDGTVCGEKLKLGLIGTVSTHPYARRDGHMIALMDLMLKDTREKGADLLILGGQHQRYQHFGFEQAGIAVSVFYSADSLRKSFGKTELGKYAFEVLRAGSAYEDEAWKLYVERSPLRFRERKAFGITLRSWAREAYAVLENGEFLGYFTSDEAASYYKTAGRVTIGEIWLKDETELGPVLYALQKELRCDEIAFTCYPYEKERIAYCAPTCEGVNVHPVEMIRVNHWLPVLRAAMRLKVLCAPVADCRHVIRFDEETLELSVKDGKTSVQPSEETPEFTLEGLAAVQTVFSPLTGTVPGMNPCPELFPLLFALLSADGF